MWSVNPSKTECISILRPLDTVMFYFWFWIGVPSPRQIQCTSWRFSHINDSCFMCYYIPGHGHPCLSHLLLRLLQWALHGAAQEDNSEATADSEYSGDSYGYSLECLCNTITLWVAVNFYEKFKMLKAWQNNWQLGELSISNFLSPSNNIWHVRMLWVPSLSSVTWKDPEEVSSLLLSTFQWNRIPVISPDSASLDFEYMVVSPSFHPGDVVNQSGFTVLGCWIASGIMSIKSSCIMIFYFYILF